MVMDRFKDFLLGTSERPLHDPGDFENFAGKRTFTSRIFHASPMTETVQGGKEISFYAMHDEQNSARWTKPGAIETPKRFDVMERGVAYWRMMRDHDAYVKSEYELNGNEDEFKAWFKVVTAHERRWGTSVANFMEDSLYLVPNKAEMEGSSGTQPYSLLVHNNEFTNGLPDSNHPGGAWTTIEGQDPATLAQWRPQQVGYAGGNPKTDGEDWVLLQAFDTMERLVHFHKIPNKESLNTATSGKYVILTDGPSIDAYRSAIRGANDHIRYKDGFDPAIPYVKFNGIDMIEAQPLRDAAVYPTGAGGALSNPWDTAGTNNSGGRYHWFNLDSIALVRHSTCWMERTSPMTDVRQPDTIVRYIDSKFNLLCENRRVNGTVYPTADVTWTPAAA